jgi:hypothetical protein
VAVRNRRLAELSLLLLFAGLATLHTWPMATDPAHLTRLDNDDTAFNAWVVAWVAHQIVRDPLRLFDAPIFYPAERALAFSEHMLVPGSIGAPLFWLGAPVMLVYNVLVWLGFALSGYAMALLIRSWTSSTSAAIVAGCLYAFNAHLLTRYSHLQALHLQFFPLALYALDRVLRGEHLRMAALLAAAFVVQALCSNYTMVMTAAALAVAAAVRPELWHRDRRLWTTLVLTGAAAALLLTPFLWPYYRVREEQGLVRTIDDVRIYSAGWRDYLATAGRLHYSWWSHRFYPGSTVLFPGVAGTLLSAAAIVTGVAWKDPRARMALAFGAAGVLLSLGTGLPGYEWMQRHVPLLQGIRAVARWGLLALIAVAVLSGFTVAQLARRWGDRHWWPVFAAALVAAVTVEALRVPLTLQRFDGVADVHARIAHENVNALLVFPLYGGNQFNLNARYLLDQTRHWKPMLNAYSSFAPPIFFDLAAQLQAFPAPQTIELLRSHGFSHVLLHRAPLERDYGAAAIDRLRTRPDLQLVFEQDGVILYRVRERR